MAVQLHWDVSESYDRGSEPSKPLIWSYNPTITDDIGTNPEKIQLYVERTAYELAGLGYRYAEKRAACMALLHLVPEFAGALDCNLLASLTFLFEIAEDYIFDSNDKICVREHSPKLLKQVILGNLYRALLVDAENNLGLEDWDTKANRYLKYCRANQGTRVTLWQGDWLADIGWPTPLKTPLPECNLFGLTKPDLLALLCLYADTRYAERLVDNGYELDDFILYIFQPVFWTDNVPHTAAFDVMAPLCNRALRALQQNPAGTNLDLAFDQLLTRKNVNHYAEGLSRLPNISSITLLLEMYDNKQRSDTLMKQVQCAVNYLGSYPQRIV